MTARPRINPLLLLPPLIFTAVAAVLLIGLSRENPNELPSALVGQPAPDLGDIGALGNLPPPTDADLEAPGVKLVNFWASWCAPCRIEHPTLVALAEAGMPVIGINYKDDPDKALAFLEELGNPYHRVGAYSAGRDALDWGIYGVPETFVVDGDGTILLRHPGPLTPEVIEERLRPAMEAAQ